MGGWRASKLGHSMGGMTAAVVARQMAKGIKGVILADPTFISPQRQREVRDSDVIEQHRRILTLDKATVFEELSVTHLERSSEVIELLAEARLQTRMSAFDVRPGRTDSRRRSRNSIRSTQAL